jgi:hypothetical protein
MGDNMTLTNQPRHMNHGQMDVHYVARERTSFKVEKAMPLTDFIANVEHVLIYDPSVDDVDCLIDGLNDGYLAVPCASASEARLAIKAALSSSTCRSLHILAHGAPGEVRVAGEKLLPEDFQANAGAHGQRSLYLWSCRTGAEECGRSFAEHVAKQSNAHVFTSTGLVGDEAQGGSWSLDRMAAPTLDVPFNHEARAGFRTVLAVADPDLSSEENTQASATALVNASEASGTTSQLLFPGIQEPSSSDTIDFIEIELTAGNLTVDRLYFAGALRNINSTA